MGNPTDTPPPTATRLLPMILLQAGVLANPNIDLLPMETHVPTLANPKILAPFCLKLEKYFGKGMDVASVDV